MPYGFGGLALVLCCVAAAGWAPARHRVVRRSRAVAAEPDDDLWQSLRARRDGSAEARRAAVDALRAALARRPPGCAAVDERLAAGEEVNRVLEAFDGRAAADGRDADARRLGDALRAWGYELTPRLPTHARHWGAMPPRVREVARGVSLPVW